MADVDPEREQFDAFKALPRDEPIEMINLIAFNERADYPADHELHDAGLSGADAYARYGKESGPVFRRVGGSMTWAGAPALTVIGPPDERWDAAFIARYPSASAFLEMLADPAYRAAVKHRQAAVRTSRLIRCAPRARGNGFA